MFNKRYNVKTIFFMEDFIMEKMFFKTMMLIVFLCLTVGASQAATVTIQADSDSYVGSLSPLTAHPSDPNLVVWGTDGTQGSPEQLNYAYFHFTAPANWNPNTCTDFSMRLTRTNTGTGAYLYFWLVHEEDETEYDVGNYVWETTPGVPDGTKPNGTAYGNTAEATFFSNAAEGGSAGDTVVFDPAIMVSYTLDAVQAHDTDGRFTIFLHTRSSSATASLFASMENSVYTGPELDLTYEPAKVAVDKNGSLISLTEGGASGAYGLYLTSAPTDDVVVTADYDADQLIVSPEILTFTPGNYTTPQTVTVSALDDDGAERLAKEAISHTTSSVDINFDDVWVSNVLIDVYDNDALTATISAVKDSTIQRSSPDNSFPSGDLAVEKFPGDPGTPNEIQISYVQFQLPSNHLYTVDATFSIVQTSPPDAANESKLYLFGVNDNRPQANADVFTWNNAPGHDLRAPFTTGLNGYDDSDPDNPAVFYLGDLDIATTGSTGVVLTTGPSESAAIGNWLSTDTDKVATIMIVRQAANAFVDTLSSVENATYGPSQLDLLYGNVPYCGRPGQIYDIADTNQDCIVNMEDLSTLANDWLE